MSLLLKTGVSLHGLTPPTLRALSLMVDEFDKNGCDLTVTSGSEGDPGDGVHMPTSYHYAGRALDIRMWNVPDHLRPELFQTIKNKLGANYDCLYYGTTKHAHIEYDPEA